MYMHALTQTLTHTHTQTQTHTHTHTRTHTHTCLRVRENVHATTIYCYFAVSIQPIPLILWWGFFPTAGAPVVEAEVCEHRQKPNEKVHAPRKPRTLNLKTLNPHSKDLKNSRPRNPNPKDTKTLKGLKRLKPPNTLNP